MNFFVVFLVCRCYAYSMKDKETLKEVKLVSNCCGASNSPLSPVLEQNDFIALCKDCGEWAEFEPEEE